MVITQSKSKDQPGKVANPARCQLVVSSLSAEKGKLIPYEVFPYPRSRLRIWSRETGSTVPSRPVPSCPVSAFLFSTPRLNILILILKVLTLTYEIPPVFRDGVHLFI